MKVFSQGGVLMAIKKIRMAFGLAASAALIAGSAAAAVVGAGGTSALAASAGGSHVAFTATPNNTPDE
jgi:hypothetical protein